MTQGSGTSPSSDAGLGQDSCVQGEWVLLSEFVCAEGHQPRVNPEGRS